MMPVIQPAAQLTPCRLIVDPPEPGQSLMAVDEALLESAAEHGGCCLRFYRWSEPTLSLGYFQHHAERACHPASRDCALVRRQTGGGAILHDRELTYSLTLSVAYPLAEDASRLYDAAHEGLVAVLTRFGVMAHLSDGIPDSAPPPEPFLCFQRRARGDVVAADAKVCGSAQRRRRGAILQHGSLLLERSAYAPELPGILELTGKALPLAKLIEIWAAEFAIRLHLKLVPGSLSRAEQGAAAALQLEKYGSMAWNRRR